MKLKQGSCVRSRRPRDCVYGATTTTRTNGCSSYPIRCTQPSVSPTRCALAGLDDAAGKPRAGVARRLRLVVVRIGVNDEAAANDVGLALTEGDCVHGDVELGAAVLAGLERGQVARMALG